MASKSSGMKSFSMTADQMRAWSSTQTEKSATVGANFLAQLNAAKAAMAASTPPPPGAPATPTTAAAAAAAATTTATTSAAGQPPRTPSKVAAPPRAQPASGKLHTKSNSKSKTLPRGFSMDKAVAAMGGAGGAPPASPFSAFKQKPSAAAAAAAAASSAATLSALNMSGSSSGGGGGDGFDDDGMDGFGSGDDAPDWDAAATRVAAGQVQAAPSSFGATAAALSKTQPNLMSAMAQFKSNANTPPATLSGAAGPAGAADMKSRLPVATSAALAAGASGGLSTPTASSTGVASKSGRPEAPKVDVDKLCDNFLIACKRGGTDDVRFASSLLAEIRHAVLIQGLDDSKTNLPGVTLRGKVWCALLGIDRVDADDYVALVSQKVRNHAKYDKVRDDSFRTFTSDADFKTVSETALIRLLNSFINRYLDVCGFCDQRFDSKPAREHKCIPFGFTYLQGMNAISGPFLYSMPEVTAFTAFSKFITKRFPLYWIDSHIGANAGCVVVDSTLHAHLVSTNCQESQVYAFACVKSLSAIGKPFLQLLKLWDFLIAFGPHFNVLCVVAQIIMIREKLLATNNPKALLDYRKWPRLRARFIIHVAMSLLPQLPLDLYDDICKHTTDHTLCLELTKRAVPT